MIYLNNNKINKLGGINRAYLNGRLIYQGYFGGVVEERVILSTTEVIVVDNGNGTYSFYEKYIKQTSTDGEHWKDSGEYTQGNEVQATLNTIQDTLCVDGNKYSQKEYVATVDGNLINTGVIILGDLLEENAEDCQSIWITLTQDTPRDIPMQTFRIDATDPETDGYYFITFSSSPNYDGENADITGFSICPDEGNIWDVGLSKEIKDQTYIEGNIYEYTFSQVVYFAGAEPNAPLSQVQYQPL